MEEEKTKNLSIHIQYRLVVGPNKWKDKQWKYATKTIILACVEACPDMIMHKTTTMMMLQLYYTLMLEFNVG